MQGRGALGNVEPKPRQSFYWDMQGREQAGQDGTWLFPDSIVVSKGGLGSVPVSLQVEKVPCKILCCETIP